jgi:hypothetical protein
MEGGMSLVLQTPTWLKSNAIRRAIPVLDTDPRLAFMFAQQSITSWRLEAEQLGDLVDVGVEGEEICAPARLLRQQIGTWRERIAPFANFIDIATRYEAQEVLAALDDVDRDFARILRRMQPAPWRDPKRLAAELGARKHQAAA